ncbi:MAG: NAD-dependent epimerase/dehydratase family protein [bacterium]|jgi:UDP-glucose 4-epimerase
MAACPNLDLARQFAGKPVLVTGGAGFIGGHLCRTLAEGGAEVRVLDDFSSGRRGSLPATVQVIEGDVADETAVRRAACGCAHIFHLAALVSVPLSIEQPELCFRTNVTGTQVVLGAALGEGVQSVVHASSASVYGRQPKLPSSEDDAVQCASPYASSKAEGESLIRMYARHHGLHSTSLRLFNVFGPGQDPKGAYSAAISAFVDAARARRAPIVYGDGTQTRDFVPIAEVVQAFLRAAHAGPSAAGEVFNVGLGERVTILEVIDMIAEASGYRATPQFAPRRAGDVDHSWADLAKIRRVLGYSPTTGLAPALAAFVRGECAMAARV